MITTQRRIYLSRLAHSIANEFSSKDITQLNEIAISEDVLIHYDFYGNTFDGMLVYDDFSREFHIHINKDKGNDDASGRGRFTLAHELSHYLIDEHRLGLKNGILSPHPSKHNINRKELIEYEADYFASCLLMPENIFRRIRGGKTFSLEKIIELSKTFHTSILSTALKFVEIGTHEITVVVSQNNIVKWYAQSKDFPQYPFKFKVGQTLPPTTVAGEFFIKKSSKYSSVEKLSLHDWFYAKGLRENRELNEQCYYSDSYGYVVSLIWFN